MLNRYECPHCGEKFNPAEQYHKKERLTCDECESYFYPFRANSRFCCKKCHDVWWNKYRRGEH